MKNYWSHEEDEAYQEGKHSRYWHYDYDKYSSSPIDEAYKDGYEERQREENERRRQEEREEEKRQEYLYQQAAREEEYRQQQEEEEYYAQQEPPVISHDGIGFTVNGIRRT